MSKGGGDTQKIKRKPGEVFRDFLLMVAGIISPVIPALITAGFLSALLAITQIAFNVDTTNSTYVILNNFAQSAFYFLPVFVAYTSAKKFDTEPVLAMLLASALLYPDWVSMASNGGYTTYFGLPVLLTTYNGAVIQIILSVWVMSKVDKFLKRVIPETVRHFLKPFLLILIMSVVTLVVTGPLGGLFTNYIAAAISWVRSVAPWAGAPAFVALLLTVGLVAPGFHLALIPIATASIASVGYDDLINIGFFCCTITPGFIALAVALKSKRNNCRQVALPAALSALFGGISEPTTYGILYKMVRPFYAYAITAFSTAVLAGLVGLMCYAFGGYSLTNIMLYLGAGLDYENFRNALLLVAFMAVMSFVTVNLIGFDDSIYDDEDEDGVPVEVDPNDNSLPDAMVPHEDVICAMPAKGSFVAQADIPDSVFSQGILGVCFGVKPSDGTVVAPVSGTVKMVASTKHAVGIVTEDGAEVLVHIGLDSVKLEGRGLETFVKVDERIEAGRRIATLDRDLFAKEGVDDTIVCILSNSSQYQRVTCEAGETPLHAFA